jgi:hypothetical protein
MLWILKRFGSILVHPKKEWNNIGLGKKGESFLFLVFLICLSLIAAILGLVLTGQKIRGTGTFFESLLLLFLASVFLFVIGIVIAFIIFALSSLFGGKNTFTDGLKIIAFSLTPYYFSSIVFNNFRIVEFFLLIYTLVLIWFGMENILNCPKGKKPFVFFLTAIFSSVSFVSIFITVSFAFL